MIWTPRVTVAALICHQGRYLLVEEKADGRLVLNQPAGHLDDGESILDAVVRETREETGGVFTPSFMVGVYRWQALDLNLTYLRFCIAGNLASHEQLVPQDKSIIRTLWLTYEELKQGPYTLRSPLVLKCVEDYQQGRRYPLALYQDVI